MAISIERACWRALACSEAPASYCASAASHRFSKDVGIAAIVVAELKFRQVERQIFLTHVVVRANDAAFEQCPEALNVVRMNLAAHVFALAMIDGLVPDATVDIVVCAVVISRDQRDFLIDRMMDEPSESTRIRFADHLAYDAALAFDCADDTHLAEANGLAELLRPSGIALLAALFAPVPVAILSADVGFVHFNNAHQFTKVRVFHSGSQAHAHVPSRAVGAGAKHPMNLKRADAFLAGQHQMQGFKPRAQRHLSFLEDRFSLERKAVGRAIILAAFFTLPVPRTRRALVDLGIVASRTVRTVRPAAQEQVGPARLLVRKQPVELSKRHLTNETRLVLALAHNQNLSGIDRGSQQSHNPH